MQSCYKIRCSAYQKSQKLYSSNTTITSKSFPPYFLLPAPCFIFKHNNNVILVISAENSNDEPQIITSKLQ